LGYSNIRTREPQVKRAGIESAKSIPWELAMRPTALYVLLLGLIFLVHPARSQNINMEHPEEVHAQQVPSADAIRYRLSNVQLQKDAKELAELCGSVSGDMDNVKRGLLPKDVVDKLKRVEKLSKRVREELTR
jgi:hypothetical protein